MRSMRFGWDVRSGRSSSRLKPLLRLALAALALLPAVSSAQQYQWRSGQITYTGATDFVTGFAANGTGYFVSQRYAPTPLRPLAGEAFYVSIFMSGIVSPAAGRMMAVHFIPPAGTRVVVDPSIPVRCFYKAMDGSGNQVEFTQQVITDNSFGANLRVFGCPQPAGGAQPFSINAIPNGGSAYLLDRRDPQRPNQPFWPMGSYAQYEFLIPLVSDRAMSGINQADRFYAPTRSIQGDGLDPWTYPYLELVAAPAAPTGDVILRNSFE
jgi:hypothetical protein